MRIISYGCRNYKPFQEDVSIEVRPLTLIYGKNGSGKSALLRLIRLLLRTVSQTCPRGAFPLEVGEVTFGTGFQDLIHRRQPHDKVGFHLKLEYEDSFLELDADVQHLFQGETAPSKTPRPHSVVSRLLVTSPQPIELNWIRKSGDPVPTYRDHGPIAFRGMLPDTRRTGSQWLELDDWRDRVELIEERTQHIGPFRANIERVYETKETAILGFDGSGAPLILNSVPDLLNDVSDWYEKNMDGWRLDIASQAGVFECNISRGSSRVNLADGGEGSKQALPVITQQLRHRLSDEPYFDLIEQPELHLHTEAQAPLGELFLRTAMTGRGQTIVETHSENLLLRVRRMIAEEEAGPDLVAVYWIDDQPQGYSTVRRIRIDDKGELDWWRPGVFSEGYEEIRALRRAVQRREARVGEQS